MKDKDIRRAIRDYLLLRGIRSWLTHDERHRPASVGISDIIGVQAGTGRFVAVEVKSARGKATQGQSKFLTDIRAAGGIAVVASCIEDVNRALDGEAV